MKLFGVHLWGLIAMAATVLTILFYIVSASTPWYATTQEVSDECSYYGYTWWTKNVLECAEGCTGIFKMPCGAEKDFVLECDKEPERCQFVHRIGNLRVTISFMTLAIIFNMVALAAFIVVAVPLLRALVPISSLLNRYKVGAGAAGLGLVCALVAIMTFGMGFPEAMQDDLTECGKQCHSLFGKEARLGLTSTWGGGPGFLIALVLLFLTNIPAIVFGFLLHMNLLVDYQAL